MEKIPRREPRNEKPIECYLDDFDEEYFASIDEDDWIAIGQENCSNQKYFTLTNQDDERMGVIGVYDTKDEKNITHTVIDPDYRGLGVAARAKKVLMKALNLPFITLTIDANNEASIRAAEKLPGVQKVSDEKYKADFHKVKYRYELTDDE